MPTFIFPSDNRVQVAYGTYGYRRSNGSVHAGIDIDTLGEPTIRSTVNGVVEFAGMVPQNSGGLTWQWGYHLRILENQTAPAVQNGSVRHTFAHCKAGSLLVKAGQTVQAGQPLATMGKTGNAQTSAQAEHVHYQVDRRQSGKWVPQNPTPWCGVPNAVGTTQSLAAALPLPTMQVLKVTGAAKGINVQGFAQPSVNAAAVSNLQDGYYPVSQDNAPSAENEVGGQPCRWCRIVYSRGQQLYLPYGNEALSQRCYMLPAEEVGPVLLAYLEQLAKM